MTRTVTFHFLYASSAEALATHAVHNIIILITINNIISITIKSFNYCIIHNIVITFSIFINYTGLTLSELSNPLSLSKHNSSIKTLTLSKCSTEFLLPLVVPPSALVIWPKPQCKSKKDDPVPYICNIPLVKEMAAWLITMHKQQSQDRVHKMKNAPICIIVLLSQKKHGYNFRWLQTWNTEILTPKIVIF